MSLRSSNFATPPVLTQDSQGPQTVERFQTALGGSLPVHKSAYIALQNISDRPLQITLEIQINHVRSALAPVSLGPKQSTVIAVPDGLLAPAFVAQRENGGIAGGITLAHSGAPGGLNALGWIEDTAAGFSTMMSFTDPARVKSNELMATQVLLGDQHALLNFPEPVHISSHVVLRNHGEKVAWFTRASLYLQKGSGTPQSLPLTLPALGPGEVFELDLATLPAPCLCLTPSPRSCSNTMGRRRVPSWAESLALAPIEHWDSTPPSSPMPAGPSAKRSGP